MKKKIETLTKEEKTRTLDLLYTAAASTKGRDAMKLFLRDLLTESERIMLGRRIWIARLILQGKKYDEIAAQLKVGYRTVYTVERWLNDQNLGYENAVQSIEKEMGKRALSIERRSEPFSYAAMKKKYPLHFLLFPEPKPKKKYRKKMF